MQQEVVKVGHSTQVSLTLPNHALVVVLSDQI